jgi:hypothetical protein
MEHKGTFLFLYTVLFFHLLVAETMSKSEKDCPLPHFSALLALSLHSIKVRICWNVFYQSPVCVIRVFLPNPSTKVPPPLGDVFFDLFREKKNSRKTLF